MPRPASRLGLAVPLDCLCQVLGRYEKSYNNLRLPIYLWILFSNCVCIDLSSLRIALRMLRIND